MSRFDVTPVSSVDRRIKTYDDSWSCVPAKSPAPGRGHDVTLVSSVVTRPPIKDLFLSFHFRFIKPVLQLLRLLQVQKPLPHKEIQPRDVIARGEWPLLRRLHRGMATTYVDGSRFVLLNPAFGPPKMKTQNPIPYRGKNP